MGALAAIAPEWVACDQAIAGNVDDMLTQILDGLYKPYHKYMRALQRYARPLVKKGMARQPIAPRRNYDGFWMAPEDDVASKWVQHVVTNCNYISSSGSTNKCSRGGSEAALPAAAGAGAGAGAAAGPTTTTTTTTTATSSSLSETLLGTTVEVLQPELGAGVHIGDGIVLTCAHVVAAPEDEAKGGLPERVGRRKLVAFGCGRVFVAVCTAVHESLDGDRDTAAMRLEAELIIPPAPPPPPTRPSLPLPPSFTTMGGVAPPPPHVEMPPRTWPAAAQIAGDVAREAGEMGKAGAVPARAAAGAAGSPLVCIAGARASAGAVVRKGTAALKGTYLEHSCWTYWGHSGAPLYNQDGQVAGLHCAWCDETGVRLAQNVDAMRRVL